MIIRTALALTASSLALHPGLALAQGAISYETGQYEYAQPLPQLDNDVVTETVEQVVASEEPVGAARVIETRRAPTPVFVSKPTIQPIDPSAPEYYTYVDAPEEPVAMPASRAIPERQPATVPVEAAQPTYVYVRQPPQIIYVHQAPVAYAPAPTGASRVIYRQQPGTVQTAQPVHYGYGYQGGATYLPAGGQVVAFDRNSWLQECRSRLDTYENESDRGEILGGLIGGVAGGVLGNRIAGRGNRTAGTLIGAGAGAILGSVAGGAIEDRQRRRSDSYGQCEAYLDDYMQQATASAGTTQYTQPGQYMLVPVTVEVPQRAVYRTRR
ncbi:glycine zipper 2TM domain-containing protein [Qipengyuania flava]|uniref:glycine zipper 2TM domain-containing protein n=1 Tax=Qipengyuania flava TaxID=192812 RepID=UPI00215AA48F|nr:glycine zipper 2TM domain-containing protein [Qipengyuania flava]